MKSALEAVDLTKSFGNSVALANLNLVVQPGEFVVLLGPSGCGKTTTLRMIAGFEPPTTGEIRLDGNVISSPAGVVPPEKRNMSMMFQSYAVWPHMTVSKNVSFGLKNRKVPREQIELKVTEALRAVHLERLRDRYPSELSGGQQQRVALARAIAVDPLLLLMDEPLSNLDAKLRHEMRATLHALHREVGFTAVYVTHDQNEAMALADRIVVLSEGVVQQIGTPSDLYLRPDNEFVARFMGRANLLPAEVLDRELLLVGDARIPYSSTSRLTPGAQAWAVVRPVGVDVLAVTDPPAPQDLTGSVTDVLFLGESIEVQILLDALDVTVTVDLRPFECVRVGERVRCRVQRLIGIERDLVPKAERDLEGGLLIA